MPPSTTTRIVIVGAGPVGLTLALDLAWRGVDVVVLEARGREAPPEPKCNHVAARSMEIFRRLGLATEIRSSGLPADYPHDISYRTTVVGRDLCRIRIPCRRDRFSDMTAADAGWPTPEPPHRINQLYLEPILRRHAEKSARIEIRYDTTVEDVSIGDGGARLAMRNTGTGRSETIACELLVGCDGGSSRVRKAMGARFLGDAVIQRVQSTFIRAPALFDLQGGRHAWAVGSVNPRRAGMMYAIDGRELWLVHNYLRPDEVDFDSVDRDRCLRTILGVDENFRYEILSKEDWFGRRLVADRLRQGAAFIAGDAAHIWVPYAGFGMNAGIADVATLGWQLAAYCSGWAPRGILDAYEAERLPITEQVSRFAMSHAEQEIKRRGAIPATIEDDGPAADAERARIGQATYDLNVRQYAAAGLNFGPYYAASPIIAHDGGTFPPYTMATFEASTTPGCRLPHFWSRSGQSLYDRLGPGFALVCRDDAIALDPLRDAFRAAGVPLTVVDIAADDIPAVYTHALTLARPDQVVAWRGDAPPHNPTALVDLIVGRATAKS